MSKNLKFKKMKNIKKMEQKLTEIGFFVGGLTDEGIIYYFNKLKK